MLWLLFSLFSFASIQCQIVISDVHNIGPQIDTIGYNCNEPVSMEMLDKHSRCKNKQFATHSSEPEVYNLLAHSTKCELQGWYC